MDLKLRPFFLGGIMKESGNRPPMMVPNKGIYMNKDIERIASYFGIPLKFIEVYIDCLRNMDSSNFELIFFLFRIRC